MSSQQQRLEAAISTIEAQRSVLGDAVVEASVSALRAQLATLTGTNSPDPAQTLKQVTILFLDVVGSTALSQRLDPEAISEVLDGALYRLTALVQEHRGKVLQYAGDSVLAAFGADEAREDDAERAVRCGLAMLALGKVLGAEVQAAVGHAGFDVRVGIHTGDVLLGGGVDAGGTIRGSAVVSDSPRRGVLVAPFYDVKLLINRIVSDHVDPSSKEPEFKITAVAVRKVGS